MKKYQSNLQTAYDNNSHSSVSEVDVKARDWAPAINRMIEQRYAFLNMEYEAGYLFRGMSNGLCEALLNNHFWHYAGDDRGNYFEKDLDILLVSQDFSDAYTVSKIWETKQDACIIIFKSDVFNQALIKKNAAMMATAEPGVVFKYPFLCEPLAFSEIEYIIVSNEFINIHNNPNDKVTLIVNKLVKEDKVIQLNAKGFDYDRALVEKEILKLLSLKQVEGAKTIKTDLKPT